jgi:hypothetical protein
MIVAPLKEVISVKPDSIPYLNASINVLQKEIVLNESIALLQPVFISLTLGVKNILIKEIQSMEN